jgi:hypothetical protein
MRKILVSSLLVVLYTHVLAQNKFAHERSAAVPGHGYPNASLRSASVLKINVFAPLLGYSQFSWEKFTSHHSSLELGLGIIGAGKNLHIDHRPILSPNYNYRPGHRNQSGGFFELGYKFVKPTKAIKMSLNNFGIINNFEGAYLKPSFIIGAYNFNQFGHDSIVTKIRRHHSFGALLLNVGDQWAIGSRLLFELYIGGGAEVDNVKGADDLYGHPFVLAVAKDNPSVNFACTAGFRVGFLFK